MNDDRERKLGFPADRYFGELWAEDLDVSSSRWLRTNLSRSMARLSQVGAISRSWLRCSPSGTCLARTRHSSACFLYSAAVFMIEAPL